MAKGVRKITGFLWALLIAIVSFFVIFIFFPDVSNRFFGVSVKGEDLQRVVKEVGDTVSEKVSEAVDRVVDKTVEKVTDAAMDAVNEKIPEMVDSASEAVNESVADVLNKSGIQSN